MANLRVIKAHLRVTKGASTCSRPKHVDGRHPAAATIVTSPKVPRPYSDELGPDGETPAKNLDRRRRNCRKLGIRLRYT